MARVKTADVAVVESNEIDKVPNLTNNARQQVVAQTQSLGELREIFGSTVDWQEIEPSFTVSDQETFEGMPIIIGAFRFNESKKFLKKIEDSQNPGSFHMVPAEFVSMLLAAFDPDTETLTTPWVIVNDGGTGIKAQLERYSDSVGSPEAVRPIRSLNGFRRSEYDYDDGDSISRATTWYLT